jgi:hypothetical protein
VICLSGEEFCELQVYKLTNLLRYPLYDGRKEAIVQIITDSYNAGYEAKQKELEDTYKRMEQAIRRTGL